MTKALDIRSELLDEFQRVVKARTLSNSLTACITKSSRKTVSTSLSGDHVPSIEWLVFALDALDIDIGLLFTERDDSA